MTMAKASNEAAPRIGPVDRQQVEAILRLWQRAGLSTRPAGRDRPHLVAAEMAAHPDQWIGAWDGDRLVGVIVVTDDGRKGWLNRLAVDPDHRRRGIARLLVDSAEALLRKRGREVIAALIEEGNSASRKLCTALGYRHQPRVHYFVKKGREDA